MKLTMTRYVVRPGKETLAREWMEVLNQRHAEVQATLADEKMALEAIFIEEGETGMTLTWVDLQGAGQDVLVSEHPIDQVHLKYWRECIDPAVSPVELLSVNCFADPRVQQALLAAIGEQDSSIIHR